MKSIVLKFNPVSKGVHGLGFIISCVILQTDLPSLALDSWILTSSSFTIIGSCAEQDSDLTFHILSYMYTDCFEWCFDYYVNAHLVFI